MKPVLVIYHADCVDGFTAAWVVRERTPDIYHPIDFHPARYGEPPPDVKDREAVYIVDFCYDRDTMFRLVGDCGARMVVLDHHATSQEALRDFAIECAANNIGQPSVTFDMERSGAGLAWDELFKRPRPWLVSYVEDRDLWRYRLPHSREVNAYLRSQVQSFERWDELARMTVEEMAMLGRGCLEHIEAYVRAAVKHARMAEMGGERLPMVNVTYESCSEVADALCGMHPDCNLAGYWFVRGDGRVQYGFRARGDFDVGAFAQQFGGGGHKGSSGCVVDAPIHKDAA